MKYFCYNEFNGSTLAADSLNIPYGSSCDGYNIDDKTIMILFNGNPVCINTSFLGTSYFCNDSDGQGKIRGKKINEIIEKMYIELNLLKLWDSEFANTFRRTEVEDHWLWKRDFYDTSIEDLDKIIEILNK